MALMQGINVAGARLSEISSPVVLRSWELVSKRDTSSRRSRNTKAYNAAVRAKEQFQAARKDSDVSSEERAKISRDSSRLARRALGYTTAQLIDPDSPDDVMEQIKRNESVYPSNELDTFRERMTGGRDCFAETLQTEEGTKVLAHIFRAHMCVPETEGSIACFDLPGRVDLILDGTHPRLGVSEPNLTAYFAISSKWVMSGPKLIRDLKKVTPKGRVETTTSPMPDFMKKFDHRAMSEEEFQYSFLHYLATGVHNKKDRDGVAGFHVHQNGAIVSNLHRNPESWPIVNYLYLRGQARHNLKLLRKGQLPVSPLLHGQRSSCALSQSMTPVFKTRFIPS